MTGADVRIDIDVADDETGTFSNNSSIIAGGISFPKFPCPKEKKSAQPLTPEICKRLFEDENNPPSLLMDLRNNNTLAADVPESLEDSELGSPLASSTQGSPEHERTVVLNASSSAAPSSTVVSTTNVVTLAAYKADTPKPNTAVALALDNTTPNTNETSINKPLNCSSTPDPRNLSTPTDNEVIIAAKLQQQPPVSSPAQRDKVYQSTTMGLSVDERPPMEDKDMLEKTVDNTTTQDDADKRDIRYLFSTLGELLEHSKTATTQLQEIPNLIKSVDKLRNDIKSDIADLSARMITVEDVEKMKSTVFTKDGKSIIKSNYARISGLDQKNSKLSEDVVSLQKEIKDLDARFEKRLSENSTLLRLCSSVLKTQTITQLLTKVGTKQGYLAWRNKLNHYKTS